MSYRTLIVRLEDLRFHSRHGVFEQERTVGNEFRVDLCVSFPSPQNVDDDSLNDMISYVDLFDIVAEEMRTPRKLLETVASSIADRIREKWSFVESGNVKITKINPPIPRMVGMASVELAF